MENNALETDPLANAAAAGPEHDYTTVVGLLSAYSAVAIRLVDYQQAADVVLLEYAAKHRLEIAALQERQNSLAEQMELIARRHPEWFAERKSVVTPCGTIKLTASTRLVVTNDELAIALIQKYYAEISGLYLRFSTELNLEALEALTDAELARLKIARISAENFSVVPAKANLGKAIKAAVAKEGCK
jgi:hypothetical protein